MRRRIAGWLARRATLPTSLQAVFGYYAETGMFAARSLALKRRVDARVDEMVADAFAPVEDALAREFDQKSVSFEYDTKLLLPAKLALGQLYRTAEDARHECAEEVTQLAVEALLDGDMRDARNDEEYGDFGVDFAVDEGDRERIAAVAQSVLQERVESRLADLPDTVAETYRWAVDRSERHQTEDEQFREWMTAAQSGESDAREQIRDEYRNGSFETQPDIFGDEDLELPYLRSQYDRVGVIYDGMIRIYVEAGFDFEDAFHRSIVLAIIGAQVWLDDVDDYAADIRDGQVTPVTAEYLLADTDAEAYDAVTSISHAYLDRAKQEASRADSVLTGIATEYIMRAGTPEKLPGGDE